MNDSGFADPDEVLRALRGAGYLADRGVATALALATALGRPVLFEGDPGVGKTSAAEAIARARRATLVRLPCYEGLDLATAAYDWDFPRQLLAIRAAEARGGTPPDLWTPSFLVRRPLLRALEATRDGEVVLLIDEIDRADDEFEAFLLEVLADHAITIPEIGRIVAERPPLVVLTSNRTRELHDALRRRCLYHWIDHPSIARETEILRLRVPDTPAALAASVATTVGRMRARGLRKPPGIAEAIDWLAALRALGLERLDAAAFDATLGAVAKDPDDLETARAASAELIA